MTMSIYNLTLHMVVIAASWAGCAFWPVTGSASGEGASGPLPSLQHAEALAIVGRLQSGGFDFHPSL